MYILINYEFYYGMYGNVGPIYSKRIRIWIYYKFIQAY